MRPWQRHSSYSELRPTVSPSHFQVSYDEIVANGYRESRSNRSRDERDDSDSDDNLHDDRLRAALRMSSPIDPFVDFVVYVVSMQRISRVQICRRLNAVKILNSNLDQLYFPETSRQGGMNKACG